MQPKSRQFLEEVKGCLTKEFRGCDLDFELVPDGDKPYGKLIVKNSRRRLWEVKWRGDPIPRPAGDDSTYKPVNQCWRLYEYPAKVYRPKLVGKAGVGLEEVLQNTIEHITSQLPPTRHLSLFEKLS